MHISVKSFVVNDNASIVIAELFSNDSNSHIGLAIQKCGSLRGIRKVLDLFPL